MQATVAQGLNYLEQAIGASHVTLMSGKVQKFPQSVSYQDFLSGWQAKELGRTTDIKLSVAVRPAKKIC